MVVKESYVEENFGKEIVPSLLGADTKSHREGGIL